MIQPLLCFALLLGGHNPPVSFGEVVKGDEVSRTISFYHTYPQTLHIERAHASCGCTLMDVPSIWPPRKPVAITFVLHTKDTKKGKFQTHAVLEFREIDDEFSIPLEAEIVEPIRWEKAKSYLPRKKRVTVNLSFWSTPGCEVKDISGPGDKVKNLQWKVQDDRGTITFTLSTFTRDAMLTLPFLFKVTKGKTTYYQTLDYLFIFQDPVEVYPTPLEFLLTPGRMDLLLMDDLVPVRETAQDRAPVLYHLHRGDVVEVLKPQGNGFFIRAPGRVRGYVKPRRYRLVYDGRIKLVRIQAVKGAIRRVHWSDEPSGLSFRLEKETPQEQVFSVILTKKPAKKTFTLTAWVEYSYGLRPVTLPVKISSVVEARSSK